MQSRKKNIKVSVKKKNIISCTYDSSNVINNIIKHLNLEETLIIIDEFHNLSHSMLNEEKDNMYMLLTNKANYLFISATPLDTSNRQEIFGNNIYTLDWNYAIENKLICDYKFYYPNNKEIMNWINETKCNFDFVKKTILINKAIFLLESIKLTNIKKCIVYLKTIEESEEFERLILLLNSYFELDIRTYNITCNTTTKKREIILTKFRNSDYKDINILCNVHIFDEGIDIPECDSIYLTHPNNNIENIIQRISRANRIDINNPEKIAKIFVWSKEENKLESFIKNISKTLTFRAGQENSKLVNNNNEIINKIESKIAYIKSNSNINKNIKNINYKHKCESCNINFKFEYLLKSHIKTNKHIKNQKLLKTCDLCIKTFSSISTYNRHLKKVHKKIL